MELEANRGELTGCCHRRTGSFQDAEDLVQDTLEQVGPMLYARYRRG
ncbi:hypothetical protein [Kitasatospora sp. NPDC048407]